MKNPRVALDELIQAHGKDYASISRLLGRNAAYIQQFIKRGTPRSLSEIDRGILARFFDVDERVLGGPTKLKSDFRGLVYLPVLEIAASAGHGAEANSEENANQVAFDRQWLRTLSPGNIDHLSIIKVAGDSMEPSLIDGDQIMVDHTDKMAKIRDGIYVMRLHGMLNVKRLAVGPSSQSVSITSDNPLYASWDNLPISSVEIIGRVIWFGRKLR